MAFLGIQVNHQIGRALAALDVPGEKVDSNSYHITLLYLGDNVQVDEIAAALKATYEITQETKPFTVKLNKVSCFDENPATNKTPIIIKITSPELQDLSKNLRKNYDEADIEFSKKFDFSPHITLSYADDGIKDSKIEALELYVQELVLWAGDHSDDRLFITFPLKCPTLKCSSLVSKINNYKKISKMA